LTVAQILAWADRHHARTGRWPTQGDGRVSGSLSENWSALDVALRDGYRGLPGGSSLAQLLAQYRHTRNKKRLPPLAVPQILVWADAYFARTGRWPTRHSGPVAEAPGETWAAVDAALINRCRHLAVGGSLAQLLAKHRGVRNRKALPRLRLKQILAWADDHHARTGQWPREKSGPIKAAPGETWAGVNAALREGLRGLPGGTTLHRLLVKHRRCLL
jgi:hypothetical protein